jgi:ribosomal protein S18 acetylase RimI-like enzyme
MSTHPEITSDELVVRVMDGPPERGFDCGRADQTNFLYDRAWDDQQAQLSVTYLYYFRGILAAYATVCMDSLPLGRGERDATVRYGEVGAMKLAQLGVHRSFQGMGLGRIVVGDIVEFARGEASRVGCRYLTLDAQPDLVGWYQSLGFQRNVQRQDQRVQNAIAHRRDPDLIAVSMRFDLRKRA